MNHCDQENRKKIKGARKKKDERGKQRRKGWKTKNSQGRR